MNRSQLAGSLLLTLLASTLSSMDFTVTSANVDDASTGLRWAINQVNASSDTSNNIYFNISGSTLSWTTMTANLPPILNNVAINPSPMTVPLTLDGTGTTFRGLLTYGPVTVTIDDINMQNLTAAGGNGGNGTGGGGGMGAGGALFVANGSSLTVSSAAFNNNAANGGSGGTGVSNGGEEEEGGWEEGVEMEPLRIHPAEAEAADCLEA